MLLIEEEETGIDDMELDARAKEGPDTKCSLIDTGADAWSFKSSKINSERRESTSARPKNLVSLKRIRIMQ